MIINLNKNDIESVKYTANEVIKVIKGGGIVISPTDTVYGMLANAFNNEAINRIYEIKGRDRDKPFLVLLKDEKSIKKFLRYSNSKYYKKKIFLES